jgi:hypothetical protein
LVGEDLDRYRNTVTTPMSFAQIISKLTQCEYRDLQELKLDVDLVVSNCSLFWSVDRGGTLDITRYRILSHRTSALFFVC